MFKGLMMKICIFPLNEMRVANKQIQIKLHHSDVNPLSGCVDVYSALAAGTVAPGGMAWRWHGPQTPATWNKVFFASSRPYFCDRLTRDNVPVAYRCPLLCTRRCLTHAPYISPSVAKWTWPGRGFDVCGSSVCLRLRFHSWLVRIVDLPSFLRRKITSDISVTQVPTALCSNTGLLSTAVSHHLILGSRMTKVQRCLGQMTFLDQGPAIKPGY